MSHLLSLSALHAAAPGVLEVVFGPDGDFEGAPLFRGPVRLTDGRYVSMDWLLSQPWDTVIMHRMAALDPCVRSVATRLAALCQRAIVAAPPPWSLDDRRLWGRAVDLASAATRETWTAEQAAEVAALFLILAPRIRDLAGRES